MVTTKPIKHTLEKLKLVKQGHDQSQPKLRILREDFFYLENV